MDKLPIHALRTEVLIRTYFLGHEDVSKTICGKARLSRSGQAERWTDDFDNVTCTACRELLLGTFTVPRGSGRR